jgi:uncharacterized HAD superfamily protein
MEDKMDINEFVDYMAEHATARYLVIGVDMDKTLCKETCWDEEQCLNATPDQHIIDQVNKLKNRHFVMIYTARRDELIPATLRWLRKNEVYFNGISNRKEPLDIYIDDKAFNPFI